MSENRQSDSQADVPPDTNSAVSPQAGSVLGNVLEQIISATGTNSEGSAADTSLRRQLQAVGTRYAGQELTLDPVLLALVDAVTGRFRLLTAEQKSTMNKAVARTLFEDAAARARLERLWHSLGDSAE